MRIGWSIVLQDYVRAGEMDYDDARTFQVVCAHCREALFKRVRRRGDGTDTHYLAHYKADPERDAQCELRVSRITDTDLAAQAGVARGQLLKRFLDVYEHCLAEGMSAGLAIGGAAPSAETIRRKANAAINRPTFLRLSRGCALTLRDRSSERAGIIGRHIERFARSTLEEPGLLALSRGAAIAGDMLTHLLTEQAARNWARTIYGTLLMALHEHDHDPANWGLFGAVDHTPLKALLIELLTEPENRLKKRIDRAAKTPMTVPWGQGSHPHFMYGALALIDMSIPPVIALACTSFLSRETHGGGRSAATPPKAVPSSP